MRFEKVVLFIFVIHCISKSISQTVPTRTTSAPNCNSIFRSSLSSLENLIKINFKNVSQELHKLNEQKNDADLSCEKGWLRYQQNCYFVNNTKVTKEANTEYCRQFNSHMISIHSRLENAFLISKVSQKRRFWTGALRDKEHINVFEWSDGSSWNFWNWNTGEPFESLEENCVIFAAGRWSVDRCDATHSQICQKSVQSAKSSKENDNTNSMIVLKEQMNELMRQMVEIKEATKNITPNNNYHVYVVTAVLIAIIAVLVIVITNNIYSSKRGLFKLGSINDGENL